MTAIKCWWCEEKSASERKRGQKMISSDLLEDIILMTDKHGEQAVSVRILLAAIALFFIGVAPLVIVGPLALDLAPLSVVTVFPTLLAGPIAGGSAALIAPIVFVALSKPILTGRTTPSKAAAWAFLISVILAYAFALLGWNDTIRYVSAQRSVALSVQALVPPIILIALFLTSGDRLSIRHSIALHWSALAWFTWSAFPCWGELP